MSWKKRPKAAFLAILLASAPAAAQPPSVILVIPDDLSSVDVSPVAEIMARHGAPIIPAILPSGRIRVVMKEQAPACGLEVVRNVGEHPDFQWIAKTAALDYVAAGLSKDVTHPPGPQTIAIASLNTVAQSVAAQAGYTVLPVKTIGQAIPLLRSGRAAVVVSIQPELDKISATEGVALHVERVLFRGETWLACNAPVSAGDVGRIAAAWNEGIASGELRDFYARAGISSLYPGP